MSDDSTPTLALTSPSGADDISSDHIPMARRGGPPGHQAGLWCLGIYLFGAGWAMVSAMTCSGFFCGTVSLLPALPWIMLVPFFRANDFNDLGLLIWPLLLASYGINAWLWYRLGRWIAASTIPN